MEDKFSLPSGLGDLKGESAPRVDYAFKVAGDSSPDSMALSSLAMKSGIINIGCYLFWASASPHATQSVTIWIKTLLNILCAVFFASFWTQA